MRIGRRIGNNWWRQREKRAGGRRRAAAAWRQCSPFDRLGRSVASRYDLPDNNMEAYQLTCSYARQARSQRRELSSRNRGATKAG